MNEAHMGGLNITKTVALKVNHLFVVVAMGIRCVYLIVQCVLKIYICLVIRHRIIVYSEWEALSKLLPTIRLKVATPLSSIHSDNSHHVFKIWALRWPRFQRG